MNRMYSSYDQLPLYLTIPELGRLLRISKSLAYQIAHNQRLGVIKLGKRMVVPKGKLLAFLEEQS